MTIMFTYLKKVSNKLKLSLRNPNELTKEIHSKFENACDKIVDEVNKILTDNKPASTPIGQRLKSAGFVNNPAVYEYTKKDLKLSNLKFLLPLIERYKTYYPGNKFITLEHIKEICKKYGLVFGPATYFNSNIPGNNLREIESFKLLDDDKVKHNNGYVRFNDNLKEFGHYSADGDSFVVVPIDEKTSLETPGLMVCASRNKFVEWAILSNDSFTLGIPDPIVLQPVPGGYLIITKWGLEGQDESLTNEQMN